MPTHFWNDPDGSKYKNAYFNKYPGNRLSDCEQQAYIIVVVM